MSIKINLSRFVLSIILGAIAGALLLGMLGLMIGDWEDMIGGATLGIFLGMAAGAALEEALDWSYWSTLMTRLRRK